MIVRALLLALAGAASALPAAAASALPPAPNGWVLDAPGDLSAATRDELNRKLSEFERQHGSQVVVAIFPRLPAGEELEDWTVRVATSWRVGRAKQDDGAVLFLFVDDHRLRLEVGYGLEGALTDLESSQILTRVLVPALRAGDLDGGVSRAVDAILAAIQGEYTVEAGAEAQRREKLPPWAILLIGIVVLFVLPRLTRRSGWRGGGPFIGGGWGGGSGGGFSGGGFSGGGGSFGGGGASGSW